MSETGEIYTREDLFGEDDARMEMEAVSLLKDEEVVANAFKRMCLCDDGTLNDDAKIVFDKLAVFCRAYTSNFSPVPGKTFMLEGRREVYMVMMNWLSFSILDYLKPKGIEKDE